MSCCTFCEWYFGLDPGKIDVTALLKLNAVESKISYLESSVVEHWGHDLWQVSGGVNCIIFLKGQF